MQIAHVGWFGWHISCAAAGAVPSCGDPPVISGRTEISAQMTSSHEPADANSELCCSHTSDLLLSPRCMFCKAQQASAAQ